MVTLQDKKKNAAKSLLHRIIVCLLKGAGKFWYVFNNINLVIRLNPSYLGQIRFYLSR